jgi:hypothetical protein
MAVTGLRPDAIGQYFSASYVSLRHAGQGVNTQGSLKEGLLAGFWWIHQTSGLVAARAGPGPRKRGARPAVNLPMSAPVSARAATAMANPAGRDDQAL